MNNNVKQSAARVVVTALCVGMLGGYAPDARAAKKFKVTLNKKAVSMKVGKTFQLKAKKRPAKAKLTWKSSKKSVVSVSAKGKLKAKKTGEAKITVTAKYKGKKKTATCKVTVTGKKVVTNQPQNTMAAPTSTPTPLQPTGTPTQNVSTAEPTKTPKPSRKPSTPAPTPVVIAYQADFEIELGDKFNVSTEVKPSEGTIEDYSVSTTNKYVASVDTRGRVVSNHLGKCLLVLTSKTDETKKETFKLSVTDGYLVEDGYNFYKEDVAHGEVGEFYYPSQYRESGQGRARIYFPPNYDPDNKKYNLVFCLHGGGQNEDYWTCGKKTASGAGCHANYIMDNLYAENKVEDAIVVFPYGNIKYDANKEYPNTVPNPAVQTAQWGDCYLFEFEVINDLLPYMENNYPIEKGPDHTAVCGLSMGCGEAIEIGLKHPDIFHYMGFFSAGPFASVNQTIVNTTEDAEKLNSQLKLCYFITGQYDHMMDDSARRFVNNCDSLGLNSVFYEVQSTGHDDRCWDRGFYEFMKHAFK